MTDKTRTGLSTDLRNNSPEAWDFFLKLYGRWIYNLARRHHLTEQEAQDLVQEIMLTVYQSLSKFRRTGPKSTFQGWLYRIIRNRIKDHFRITLRSPSTMVFDYDLMIDPLSQCDGESDDNAIPEAESKYLRAKIEKMARVHFRNPVLWDVYVAVEMEGGNRRDVAKRFDIRVETIHKQVHRVKLWLASLQASSLFPPHPNAFDHLDWPVNSCA